MQGTIKSVEPRHGGKVELQDGKVFENGDDSGKRDRWFVPSLFDITALVMITLLLFPVFCCCCCHAYVKLGRPDEGEELVVSRAEQSGVDVLEELPIRYGEPVELRWRPGRDCCADRCCCWPASASLATMDSSGLVHSKGVWCAHRRPSRILWTATRRSLHVVPTIVPTPQNLGRLLLPCVSRLSIPGRHGDSR